jgi:hypothetical protein
MSMGFSFFALGVAIALSAFGLVLDRNGRKADRARRRLS